MSDWANDIYMMHNKFGVKEWFEKNKSLTCLELGSYFDPLLNNKSYMYHTGNLLYCNICNPSQNASNCALLYNQPSYP